MKRFVSTKLFRLLATLIVFGMLVFWNPYRFFSPVQAGLSVVLSPFSKVFYVISLRLDATKDFIFSVGQLKRENESLLEENMKLLSENAGLRDQKNENEFLRQQLELLPRDKFVLEPASVVGQDVTGLGNWIDIDRGSSDGISEGMAVIISKGVLVGKVQQVFPNSAKVMLLSHPKSAINALSNDTQAKGITKGEYGLGIVMDMIMQTDTINIGSEIVTSGIGGSVPRGLYVGTVREVHPSEDHLFQQAVIGSPVDQLKLRLVFVIKSVK
jgi:rod shape-determining protein MreC